MNISQEDIRNFLLKNGLYQTLAMLDNETNKSTQINSTETYSQNAEIKNAEFQSPAMNLSFGEENESIHHPRDSSFRADSHISVKNHFEQNLEKSNSQSNNPSTNSIKKKLAQNVQIKKEDLPNQPKLEIDDELKNPFMLLSERLIEPMEKPKEFIEEDKFSFGGEGEVEGGNEFDSFSKSHNNKFSKNENEEMEENNIFGNSFDVNLEIKSGRRIPNAVILEKSKQSVFLDNDEFLEERPKSEVNTPTGYKTSIKPTQEVFKSEVKSIDNDVGVWNDFKVQQNKRHSQGFNQSVDNQTANNRGLAKKLFNEFQSDILYLSPTRTTLPTRKSDSSHNSKQRGTGIKPDYADNGKLNSN